MQNGNAVLLVLLLSTSKALDVSTFIEQRNLNDTRLEPRMDIIYDFSTPIIDENFIIKRDPDYDMINFFYWYKYEQAIFCRPERLQWNFLSLGNSSFELLAGYDYVDQETVELNLNELTFKKLNITSQPPTFSYTLKISFNSSLIFVQYNIWNATHLHRPIPPKGVSTSNNILLLQAGNSLVIIDKFSKEIWEKTLNNTFESQNSYFVSEIVNDNFYFLEFNPSTSQVCYKGLNRTSLSTFDWYAGKICGAINLHAKFNERVKTRLFAIYSIEVNELLLWVLNDKNLYRYSFTANGLTSRTAPLYVELERMWRLDHRWLGISSLSNDLLLLKERANFQFEKVGKMKAPLPRNLTSSLDGSIFAKSDNGTLFYMNINALDTQLMPENIIKFVDPDSLLILSDSILETKNQLIGAQRMGVETFLFFKESSTKVIIGKFGNYSLPVSCQITAETNSFADLNFVKLQVSQNFSTPVAQHIIIHVMSKKYFALDVATYVCLGIAGTLSLIFIAVFCFFIFRGKQSIITLETEISF